MELFLKDLHIKENYLYVLKAPIEKGKENDSPAPQTLHFKGPNKKLTTKPRYFLEKNNDTYFLLIE